MVKSFDGRGGRWDREACEKRSYGVMRKVTVRIVPASQPNTSPPQGASGCVAAETDRTRGVKKCVPFFNRAFGRRGHARNQK